MAVSGGFGSGELGAGLMGSGFQLWEMKKLWGWVVVMVAVQRECA